MKQKERGRNAAQRFEEIDHRLQKYDCMLEQYSDQLRQLQKHVEILQGFRRHLRQLLQLASNADLDRDLHGLKVFKMLAEYPRTLQSPKLEPASASELESSCADDTAFKEYFNLVEEIPLNSELD